MATASPKLTPAAGSTGVSPVRWKASNAAEWAADETREASHKKANVDAELGMASRAAELGRPSCAAARAGAAAAKQITSIISIVATIAGRKPAPCAVGASFMLLPP
jgi:hypothetical protein